VDIVTRNGKRKTLCISSDDETTRILLTHNKLQEEHSADEDGEELTSTTAKLPTSPLLPAHASDDLKGLFSSDHESADEQQATCEDAAKRDMFIEGYATALEQEDDKTLADKSPDNAPRPEMQHASYPMMQNDKTAANTPQDIAARIAKLFLPKKVQQTWLPKESSDNTDKAEITRAPVITPGQNNNNGDKSEPTSDTNLSI